MTNEEGIRWGVLGTAKITRSSFLPALKAAGGGKIAAVAGRDSSRTGEYAYDLGIPDVKVGYESLVEDPGIDAVYIPLPNSLHGEWTVRSLEAGKAVLCEKPLCGSLAETRKVLEAAAGSPMPLWEAFVFPFQPLMTRIHALIASGRIGPVREIHSEFHFPLSNRDNIRLSTSLEGGALNDVGCYPIHFAQLVFGKQPVAAVAMARWAPEGVDEEMQGVLEFPEDRRLMMSCGMSRSGSTFTRVIGTKGEIRLTNPFHPGVTDTIVIRDEHGSEGETIDNEEPTFAPAIRHIHSVIRERVAPQHLAIQESLATALGLDLLHRASASGRKEQAAD